MTFYMIKTCSAWPGQGRKTVADRSSFECIVLMKAGDTEHVDHVKVIKVV